MKVKIINCSHDQYWYNDCIGLSFDVRKEFNDFRVLDDFKSCRIIEKQDCEIIEDKPMNDKQEQVSEIMFKNIYCVSIGLPHEYEKALDIAKKSGWIVKDELESAIEEYKDYVKECSDWGIAENISNKANKVIELLQNKIKTLEGK